MGERVEAAAEGAARRSRASTCSATSGGDVLYVGKAKSLRPRVRSYFQRSRRHAGGDRAAAARASHDVEVIVTGTEVEALHLEQNLVKRHRPPFNVRLRDDKSFPYIAVTVEDEYPRVMFTRERHRRGVVYFGPYANAKKVRETLDVLNRVFPYRPCEGPKPGRHSGIPCLDYHIDRCLAPCVGYVSKEDYREVIDGVIEFLSGETRPILRELERRMREAAAEERFEDAARYRNRLFAVQHLAERQAADRRSVGTVDVIGVAAEGDRAAVQIFPLRGGKLVDRHSFHLENVGGPGPDDDPRGVLRSSTTARRRACRRRSSSRATPATSTALARVPRPSGAGPRVELRAAERGEKRRLQELAAENARLALDIGRGGDRAAAAAPRRGARGAARGAQPREPADPDRVLRHLEHPGRIDRRHRWWSSRTRSPKKAHYRKFGVRGLDGQDDFAAMAEVISRRFARLERRDRRGVRRGVRGGAEPRRHRRRQGPALGGARRDAGVRPAARGRDRAREAGRGGVRARAAPIRSCSTRTRRACSCCSGSATRRTASRSASTASAASRGSFESLLRRAAGRRAGAPPRAAAPLRLGRARRRRLARRSSKGVPELPPKTARAIYAQLHRSGRAGLALRSRASGRRRRASGRGRASGRAR